MRQPVLCAGCGHPESMHIYFGPDMPLPCAGHRADEHTTIALKWARVVPCGCPDFRPDACQPEPEGAGDAR